MFTQFKHFCSHFIVLHKSFERYYLKSKISQETKRRILKSNFLPVFKLNFTKGDNSFIPKHEISSSVLAGTISVKLFDFPHFENNFDPDKKLKV